MTRVKWGNVLVTLLSILALVYGGAVQLNLAPSPTSLSIGERMNQLGGVLRHEPDADMTATVVPTRAPRTAAAVAPVAAAEATETPTVRPVASVLPLATVAPTLGADDEWFRSEVPVPESQGNFPLGYITVAFDKEFPPYSPVVMLYQERLAEKRGLGVHFVPFDIEDRNRVSETRRGELLQSGGFDVLLTTINSYALWGGPDVGRVTGIIGESAGADKAVVQASAIKTFNDFYGKAVSYSDSSVSEYLLYYMLRVGGVPAQAVIRFGQENLNQAVRRYTDRQAHAVVGWTSSDMDTAVNQPGSKVLMTSDQFRVTMDVIVTGVEALHTKPAAVQAFHDAWFEAEKTVLEHPDQAAASMQAWNGSWTGVNTTQDLTDALGEFAQATLADNRVLFGDENLPILEARYKEAQAVWMWGGRDVRRLVADNDLSTVFDPNFVRTSARDASLTSMQPPVNPTFHLTANPQVKGLSPEQQQRLKAVTVLALKEVQFEQGSAELSASARQAIDTSLIPVLRNTIGTYVKIEGSAAWPQNSGLNETSINALAFERARAVEDYVIKFGVPVERLILSSSVPRCRDCTDARQTQQDNRVLFTLVTPE